MHPRHMHVTMPMVVSHSVVCVHQAEIEVWPSSAQAYFLDERFSDPASAQIRFEAAVYNTPSRAVRWEVQDIHGGPGNGTIDAAGLYTAPNKGAMASGTTEIVAATAVDDPFRKAFALVTLVGRGPEPPPVPRLEIFPRHASLYLQSFWQNQYIDASNKRQLFRVFFHESPPTSVRWTVRRGASENVYVTGDPWYLYNAPSSLGSLPPLVSIEATIPGAPDSTDRATVLLQDYEWPPLTSWGS